MSRAEAARKIENGRIRVLNLDDMEAPLSEGATLDERIINKGMLHIVPEYERQGSLVFAARNGRFEEQLKHTFLRDAVHVIPLGNRWVQDHFDVLYSEEGSPVLIFPYQSPFIEDYANFIRKERISSVDIVEAPFNFEGGNVIQDIVRERRILLVGYDTLEINEKRDPESGWISAKIMAELGAKKIIEYPENEEITADSAEKYAVILRNSSKFIKAEVRMDEKATAHLKFTYRPGIGDSNEFDITPEQLFGHIKRIYSVDDVIIIGDEKNKPPKQMFHLDQVILPTGDGKILRSRIYDESHHAINQQIYEFFIYKAFFEQRAEKIKSMKRGEVFADYDPRKKAVMDYEENRKTVLKEIEQISAYLGYVESKLMEAGYYAVLPSNTDIRHIKYFQSFVNSTPYSPDSSRRIITHGFPNKFANYELREFNKMHKSYLKSLGFHVNMIKETNFPWLGNTHCVLKIIK